MVSSKKITSSNNAGYDVAAPIVMVFNTYREDFCMYYNNDDKAKIHRSALIYFVRGNDDNPYVLSAGESESIRPLFSLGREGKGYTPARFIMTTDSSAVSDAEWLMLESAMRPLDVSDDEWTAWWQNIQPRIGETMGDVAQFINELQELSIMLSPSAPTTLPEVVSVILSQRTDYVPNYAIKGVFKNSDGEGVVGVMVSLYELIDGQSQLISSTCTDNQGAYVLYGMEENGNYEIVTSCYFADAEGNEKNSLSFSCDGSDKQVALTEYREEDIVSYESGVRIASTGESLRYTSVVKGNELRLYYEVDGKKYNDLIAEGLSLENGAIYWSEKEKMLLIGWNEGDEEEKDAKFRIAKWSAEGLLYSDIIDVSSPGAKDFLVDLYMNEMGNVIAVTESEDGATVNLRFHDVDPDAENISWSANEQDHTLLDEGGKISLSVTIPYLGIKVTLEGERDVDVAGDRLSATGTISISVSLEVETKKESYSFGGTFEAVDEVEYDCNTRTKNAKKVKRGGSLSFSVKSEKLPGVLSGLNWIKKKLKDWCGIKLIFGYTGSGELSASNESIGGAFSVGIYARNYKTHKNKFSGSGTLSASFTYSSNSGFDADVSVKFSISGECDVNFFFFKKSISFSVWASYSLQDGWDYDADFEISYEKEIPYPKVLQVSDVVDINNGIYQYDDVIVGDYASSSHVSAYVYLMDTGHLEIQYYNAQTGALLSDLNQIEIEESTLLKGWSNVEYLSTASDGQSNVYIAVEGYTLNEEEFNAAFEDDAAYTF